jgi:hypothetical protein
MQLLILCLSGLDLRTLECRARKDECLMSSLSSSTSESAKELGVHSTSEVNSTCRVPSSSSACDGRRVSKPAMTPSRSNVWSGVQPGRESQRLNQERAVYVVHRRARRNLVVGSGRGGRILVTLRSKVPH